MFLCSDQLIFCLINAKRHWLSVIQTGKIFNLGQANVWIIPCQCTSSSNEDCIVICVIITQLIVLSQVICYHHSVDRPIAGHMLSSLCWSSYRRSRASSWSSVSGRLSRRPDWMPFNNGGKRCSPRGNAGRGVGARMTRVSGKFEIPVPDFRQTAVRTSA